MSSDNSHQGIWKADVPGGEPLNYIGDNVPADIFNGKFIVKDSGERQEFETGAKRDTQKGKPRYDLISPLALKRVAKLYTAGLEKYGEDNWSKGMPFRRFYASMMRHAIQFAEGDKSEDHLSAVVFNALAIIHFQEIGRADLDDMPKWNGN
jgi:hypothetical protein